MRVIFAEYVRLTGRKEIILLVKTGITVLIPGLNCKTGNPVFVRKRWKRSAQCEPKKPSKFKKEAKTMADKQKIRVRLKSYDHTLVDTAAEKVVEIAKRNGSAVSGPIPLPTEKEIVTILRAVHKYKDSREQFEMRTHKRLIDIINPQQKTIEALMSVELPAGVDIEIKA